MLSSAFLLLAPQRSSHSVLCLLFISSQVAVGLSVHNLRSALFGRRHQPFTPPPVDYPARFRDSAFSPAPAFSQLHVRLPSFTYMPQPRQPQAHPHRHQASSPSSPSSSSPMLPSVTWSSSPSPLATWVSLSGGFWDKNWGGGMHG